MFIRAIRHPGLRPLLLSLALLPAAGIADTLDANLGFDREFGERFLEEYWQRNPDAAIAEGYYRVAERLAVPDAAYRAEYLRFLDQWRARLHAVDPRRLDPSHRADWAVLDNALACERWQWRSLREWQWNPATYNVASAFALLLNTPYAPLDQRLRTVSARLAAVPAYYRAARANIHDPTREHTELAIEQNRGALSVFGPELEKQLAGSGLSAQERAVFLDRLYDARNAIRGHVAWLEALERKRLRHGARSFRLGRGLYEEKFACDNPGSDGAQALYRRAQAEKERVLARMDALARQLWPKYLNAETLPEDRETRIARVIEKISERHTTPQHYVAAVEALIPQLEHWVTSHDLIDLDPSRPLQVRVTPPYERGVAVAGIEAPGPYDPTARTYFNVDPLDDLSPAQAESFLREYNDWMLPIFIIHEAIPGHYVQLLYANKSPSKIKSVFGNGSMIEGWAVYSERMMMESGYGGGAPELWLMYWKWYLRSVTNTLLDYGVHTQGMSEDAALHLLTREAFQSRKEAVGKWRRVQLSSVQLTRYFAGFSEIYRFREARRQKLGDAFSLKRFNERFLSYGSAPVATIEALMEEAPN